MGILGLAPQALCCRPLRGLYHYSAMGILLVSERDERIDFDRAASGDGGGDQSDKH